MIRFSPRPRFSLRTLFVLVGLLGLILAWQMDTIRQRREALAQLQSDIDLCCETRINLQLIHNWDWSKADGKIPWFRQLLGDRAIEILTIPYGPDDPRALRLFAQFPETKLIGPMPQGVPRAMRLSPTEITNE